MGKRVFAVSDIHVDFGVNEKWFRQLSCSDYRNDLLILAGDVTHKLADLVSCLRGLASRFAKVLFVPGNHDLWVLGESAQTSLQKFAEIAAVVEDNGATMRPHRQGDVLFVPLLGWYDYSFGEPGDELRRTWMDYHACRWPEAFGAEEAAAHFTRLNPRVCSRGARKVITFSHFLPRIDLVPAFVSARNRRLDPVLGSTRLERQLRELNSSIHVYGHSHINRSASIDGVTYVNNAFGYPGEGRICARRLLCIDEI
jgi:Icc-related predicted phosphoesterase